jgi:phosphoesterase RecJ-like protein
MTLQTEAYERQLDEAKTFIEQYDRFLVVSHVHPDGDAISSTLTVGYLLHQLGKTYTLVNADPIPGKFSFLWGSDSIQRPQDLVSKEPFDYIIAVDCADYSRIGSAAERFSERAQILNIDHHPTNDHYGHCHLIRPEAAATAEVLYDLLKRFELKWGLDLAQCVYTGILTDTGGFRYANTSPRVMEIASELLSYGVNAHEMAEMLLEKRTLSHIKLLQKALATLSFSPDRKISWMVLSLEDLKSAGGSNEDVEGLVNYPRNIEGVEVGILFREVDENEVKISLRSAGKVDVAHIAKCFNGGGHVRAAGATVKKPLEETIASVVDQVKQVLKG